MICKMKKKTIKIISMNILLMMVFQGKTLEGKEKKLNIVNIVVKLKEKKEKKKGMNTQLMKTQRMLMTKIIRMKVLKT